MAAHQVKRIKTSKHRTLRGTIRAKQTDCMFMLAEQIATLAVFFEVVRSVF